MEFDGQPTLVLDLLTTPEMRRLKDIKQLGLAHHVYPSAEHSRHIHALGVAYLATKFGEHLMRVSSHLPVSLAPDEATVRDLAVAALCHDLGHGPFSHVWERCVMRTNEDREKWLSALDLTEHAGELRDAQWHEIATIGILQSQSSELHQKLEAAETGLADTIGNVLLGNYWPPYAKQLLAGDVDVDRCDYLLRDSLMGGLKYGDSDVARLVDTSYIVENSEGDLVVAFEEWRARSAIEDLLEGRTKLYESMYLHKTVRSAEALLQTLIVRLSEPEIGSRFLDSVGPLSRKVLEVLLFIHVDAQQLMYLHDRSVMTLVEEVAMLPNIDNTCTDLSKRLLSRTLPKLVDVSPKLLDERLGDPDIHDELKAAIEPLVPGDPSAYYHFDGARHVGIGNSGGGGGYLLHKDGSVRSFEDDERIRNLLTRRIGVGRRLFVAPEAVKAVCAVLDR